jgi:hypothetical protein
MHIINNEDSHGDGHQDQKPMKSIGKRQQRSARHKLDRFLTG